MVRTAALILAVLASAASAAPKAEWDIYRCTFTQKVQCDYGGTCHAVDPAKIDSELRTLKMTYTRCGMVDGGRTCDRYPVTLTESGDFLVASQAGGSFFVKISGDLRATEVVSFGHDTLVASGICTDGPPPLDIEVPVNPSTK